MRKSCDREYEYLFRLDYRPPYDWEGVLSFLVRRAIPGVETVDGGRYSRAFSLLNKHGVFEVCHRSRENTLIVRLNFPDPDLLFVIIGRIRSMFDLDADWLTIANVLGGDPLLGPLIEDRPGMRVPGCWDGFELTVLTILGHCASIERAARLAGRLVTIYGAPVSPGTSPLWLFPGPAALATRDLREADLADAQANAIRALACAVRERHVRFDSSLDKEELRLLLRQASNVDDSIMEHISMRVLRDPDAFPLQHNRALRQAMGCRNREELNRRVQALRPWRAYAAMYLWSAIC